MTRLILEFASYFAKTPLCIGTAKGAEYVHFPKPGFTELNMKPYRLGPVVNQVIDDIMEQYVKAGRYVRGASPIVSPGFLVMMPRSSENIVHAYKLLKMVKKDKECRSWGATIRE